MNKAIRQNLLPIISLAVILLIGVLFAFKAANALVSFHEADSNWEDYSNSIDASKIDTYPYDSSTATISMVSMDVLYGTTRSLVWYHGEFPYAQIYDDEDEEYRDGWEGYYAEDGTDAGGTNPGYGAACGGVDAASYWGSGVDSDSFENVPTAEQINAGNVKSLRLYASTMTKTGFTKWIGGALYWVVRGLAWVAVLIISLIVRAKNISLEIIMDILNLDGLNDVMTKNFIWDGDHLKLSAFTGFCILILIFTITAFAIKWAKGGTKTQGIWEILGTIGIGLIIIGMCLTGRISSLGSSISTLASKVMYTVAESLSVGGDGHAFEIDITDAEHETEIIQMCEMSLVNKAFIDLQLCSQFDVSSVDELKFDKFGDSGGSVAATYLAGVDSADMHDDFNDNLGYYYWFANSSATQKTSLNATFPDTDTQSVHNKLSSIMTYLQVQHNANAGNAAVTELIENTTRSFASPGGGPRFLCLLVFAIVLILLAIVLFKYALNVVIAKIQMFISLLGMILAGPLILTSNQKLVKTGKAILGMLVVSFLEITVYSIIFDIIIYTVCAMFKPDILPLLATMALLILLLYFNPMIAQKIKQIMEQTERQIAPELVNGRRAAKNWAKAKARQGIEAYDKGNGKIVGYDADGQPIYEKHGGDALSKLMHTGANAVFAEGNEHEGLIGMHTKLNKDRQKTKADSARQIRENAELEVERKRAAIYNEADHEDRGIHHEIDTTVTDAVTGKDEFGEDTYDDAKLSEEERRMVADRRTHRDELEELENNADYQDLLKMKADLQRENAKLKEGEEARTMSTEDAARLAAYKSKIEAKKNQIKAEKGKITEAIKERAAREAMAKRGLDYDAAEGGDLDSKIENATKKAAIEKHRDEMEATLNTAIAAMSKEVNNTSAQGKIGRDSTQKLNKAAAEAQAAAMLQLSQLQNGEDIMKAEGKDSEAKQAVRDIVDKVSQHYDGDKHSADAHVREHLQARVEEADTQEKYDAAKAALDTEMKRQAEEHGKQKAAVKDQYKTAKADAGKRGLERASVQEQLQSAINNRSNGATPTPTADSNETPNMSAVVNAAEANAPKTTTHAAQPQPQAQPKPQPQQQAQAKPQPQAQPAPNMYSNPAPAQPQSRSNASNNAVNNLDVGPIPGDIPAQPQARPQQNAQSQPQAAPARNPQQNAGHNMYTNPAQARPQPDMSSVINQREAVSAAEARQGEARAQQQQMASVIESQTQSISHGAEATRADYVVDEQKMDAMNQDRRMIKGIYGESTNNGGRQ